MRGQWFIDGTWMPVEEDESDLIEKEHLACFRGQQIQDAFETDTLAKTVDRKDGCWCYLEPQKICSTGKIAGTSAPH
ncbi:phospholipase DDHD1-like [Sinocyclocheilus anshuiensis]|uniref:phospholipase DDHD1-like n=1 Tax=Sinocyclocheilus anshuiensis TaxID=1608454 RepID=UPI0007BA1772|nr:PREDICTED: phospholipase DDHD1-like [Sinocyclocheilus anshuiensis]